MVPKGTAAVELLPRKSQAVAARLGGELIDLGTPLETGGELTPITPEAPEALEILRHSTSHIMAEAVRALFPGVKVTIGPAIEN
ncbi:MAG: threonine--tRNA ligase, partial [Thermodesulfobacteriota bacterium]